MAKTTPSSWLRLLTRLIAPKQRPPHHPSCCMANPSPQTGTVFRSITLEIRAPRRPHHPASLGVESGGWSNSHMEVATRRAWSYQPVHPGYPTWCAWNSWLPAALLPLPSLLSLSLLPILNLLQRRTVWVRSNHPLLLPPPPASSLKDCPSFPLVYCRPLTDLEREGEEG